jgi:hypothetical protein
VAWTSSQKSLSARVNNKKQKENMKKLQLAILAVGLAGVMSASASITYSGTGLDDLINPMIGYEADGTGSSANYVAAVGSIPAYGALYTPNASVGGPTAAIWVGNEVGNAGGNIPGTLSTFVASYTLLSSGIGPGPGNFAPYWVLWMTDDTGYHYPIVSTYGGPLNGSSLIHVGNLTHGSITLAALDASIDPVSGLPYGQETINWAGLEIGNGGTGPGTANIESITIGAVPEPTTMIAGAMLLLPFGASTLRILRKTRTA